jgi:acyl carrier protein
MALEPKAVFVELTALLSRICQHEQTDLSAGTLLEDIPGIDSLRLLQAVAHLEDVFRVEIDVVTLNKLERVQDVLDAICTARPLPSLRHDPDCPGHPST